MLLSGRSLAPQPFRLIEGPACVLLWKGIQFRQILFSDWYRSGWVHRLPRPLIPGGEMGYPMTVEDPARRHLVRDHHEGEGEV